MPQYKVLTQKDRFFSGKFSPEKLEAAINGYAAEGWRAVSMATATIPGLGSREELLVLMERGQVDAELNGTYEGGVFFTESPLADGRLGGKPIKVSISRQNANLGDVKRRLAKAVVQAGGNALVNFEYGQRTHPIWQQVFTLNWDSESWYGKGYAARL